MMGIEIYDVYVDDGISGGVPLQTSKGKTLADDVKSKRYAFWPILCHVCFDSMWSMVLQNTRMGQERDQRRVVGCWWLFVGH